MYFNLKKIIILHKKDEHIDKPAYMSFWSLAGKSEPRLASIFSFSCFTCKKIKQIDDTGNLQSEVKVQTHCYRH